MPSIYLSVIYYILKIYLVFAFLIIQSRYPVLAHRKRPFFVDICKVGHINVTDNYFREYVNVRCNVIYVSIRCI